MDDSAPFDSSGGDRRQPLAYDAAPYEDVERPLSRLRRSLSLAVAEIRTRGSFILALLGLCAFAAWFTGAYIITREAPGLIVSGRPLEWTLRGPGLLDATNKVTISARIQGRLREVNVDANDRVHKGDVLAVLDQSELQSLLAVAKADADAAARAVEDARLSAEGLRIGLERSESDLQRRRKLLASGSAARADIDTLETSARQLATQVAGADNAILRAEALARSAEANAAAVEARLHDTVIRSPLDGVVVSRDRNPGDLVLPGGAFMQIVDPTSVVVSARFDESAMGVLDPGLVAQVSFTSAPGQTFHGKVLRLSRKVDVETREFALDVPLGDLPRNWALGQRTSVEIGVRTRAGAMMIPSRYLTRRDGKPGVWRSAGGRAVWTAVQLGSSAGPYIEVEGLREGDAIFEPRGRYWLEPIALRAD